MLIITRLDRGGSAESTLYLAEALVRRGHRVTLVTGKTLDPQEDFTAFRRRTGIPLILVPCLQRRINPWSDTLAFIKLVALMQAVRPEVVHTHTSKAAFLGRLAARWLRVPAIIHTPHGHVFYGYFGPLTTRLYAGLERWAAHFTDRIIALTERGKREHLARKIGTARQFAVIPCGIRLEKYRRAARTNGVLRRAFGFSDRDIVIGWVGRLVPIKACDVFLHACRRVMDTCPEARFLVVGDGELRPVLQNLSQRLGLEGRVVFTGLREDIPQVLHSLDLYVHTARNEGLGRTILEAMASEVPVIAAEVGGVPDIVVEGTGSLVKPGDPGDLARRMVECIRDAKNGATMVRQARKRVRGFAIRRMVDETEEIYRQVYESKR